VRRPASRPSSAGSSHWQPKGAAAQLQRILQVIPHLADGDEHAIAEVAQHADTDAATVYADLKSLVDRFDLPAGHIEGVQLYLESERVSVVSNHFLRPMRLTVSELCALELGLVMLRAQRPPHEHEMLARARMRLRAVIAQLAGDPIPDRVHHASIGESGSIETLGVFREALARSHTVRLAYRKSGSSTADVREVCPFALVASSGMLYVVAHCRREDGLRLFRMDRVESAELLDGTFERPADFEVDDVVADGRAFQGEAPETLIVRFSPRIARWIAEREGVDAAADGSLTMAYPLADPAWAMRFVLQYGAEAEVLEPVSMREAIRTRLLAVLLQTDAKRLPTPES
jgi:proteasome accessory factor C